MRKPVFRVSDQVKHKPGCTVTADGWRLENSGLGRRGSVLSMAPISCAVQCKCAADLRLCFRKGKKKKQFSHDADHLIMIRQMLICP